MKINQIKVKYKEVISNLIVPVFDKTINLNIPIDLPKKEMEGIITQMINTTNLVWTFMYYFPRRDNRVQIFKL